MKNRRTKMEMWSNRPPEHKIYQNLQDPVGQEQPASVLSADPIR